MFKKYERLLKVSAKILGVFPVSFRKILWRFLANTPGIIGIGGRFIVLKSLALECGSNVAIHRGSYILNIDNIKIGSNVSIHPMCYIDAAGGICIGNDVSIAHAVTIMSSSHYYKNSSLPIKDQGVEYKSVMISDNVWIGAKATILGGVIIKNRTIVAAAALVNRSFSAGVIVAGIPAKTVRSIE